MKYFIGVPSFEGLAHGWFEQVASVIHLHFCLFPLNNTLDLRNDNHHHHHEYNLQVDSTLAKLKSAVDESGSSSGKIMGAVLDLASLESVWEIYIWIIVCYESKKRGDPLLFPPALFSILFWKVVRSFELI